MTWAPNIGGPGVQIDMQDDRQHRRQIAQTMNQMQNGRLNCGGVLTLNANAATTTITDARISLQSAILLAPVTAHAAAELPTLFTTCANGVATVNHTNNAQTDRVFQAAIVG